MTLAFEQSETEHSPPRLDAPSFFSLLDSMNKATSRDKSGNDAPKKKPSLTPKQALRGVKGKLADRLILWWAIWSVVGMAALVLAFSVGLLPAQPDATSPLLSDSALPDHPLTISPVVMFLLSLSATTFLVHSLLKLQGTWVRLGIFVLMLLLVTLATPICAIWDINFNTMGMLIALLVSGIGASITSHLFERKPSL